VSTQNRFEALERKEEELNLLESLRPSLNAVQEEPSKLAVVLDSGAADHVADRSAAKGYRVQESAGSKRGEGYLAANGERIANEGQMTLSLVGNSQAGALDIRSTFQVARTNRPLWSVGKICDAGYTVVFDAGHATVHNAVTGREVCVFERVNGLYATVLDLKPEEGEPFHRQGA